MRRLVQLLFLAAFVFLSFAAACLPRAPVPADLFLQSSPLLWLATLLASKQWMVLLPALAVLASALLAGRIFCGFVCPFGALFDLMPGGRRSLPRWTAAVPYALLLVIALCSIGGVNLAGFLDPLPLLNRIVVFTVRPFADLLAALSLDAVRPLAERLHLVRMARSQLELSLFYWSGLTVLIAIALGAANLYARRFWCRCLCPLGALLGLCGSSALVRRRVNDRCTGCRECSSVCPVDAVADNPALTRSSACTMCRACGTICPEKAIRFLPRRGTPTRQDERITISRRAIIASLAAAAGMIISLRTTPQAAAHRLIRPPGALPEKIFLQQCVRCGQCMHVCPTNTLQPCLFESGVEGLWTPRLAPRHAACDQTCCRCNDVCPTGALRPLDLEEKKHAKIGTAYIVTDRCLVWAQNRLCFICDEQCPYNAIVFRWHEGSRKPFVVDVRCNGCGFCEQHCPVGGESAIIVTAHGELRLVEGSYIAEAQRRQLTFTEDPGDDRFLQEEKLPPDGRTQP